MSGLEDRKKQIIERVASMVVFGATAENVMLATGISRDQLDQIEQWPEYSARVAELQTEQFEQQKMVDQGWDFLEAKSLENLCKVIEFNKDPELNLRVARVANQASRSHRGKHAVQQPIDPQTAIARTVVLDLNVNFVQKIQQNNIIRRRDDGKLIEQKDVDCLSQAQIERTFGISGPDIVDQAAEEFVQEFA